MADVMLTCVPPSDVDVAVVQDFHDLVGQIIVAGGKRLKRLLEQLHLVQPRILAWLRNEDDEGRGERRTSRAASGSRGG